MQETESIDEYILQHIDPESDYLKALYRDTHVKLLRPRMALLTVINVNILSITK